MSVIPSRIATPYNTGERNRPRPDSNMNRNLLRLACLTFAAMTVWSLVQTQPVVRTAQLSQLPATQAALSASQVDGGSQIDNFINEQLKGDPIPLEDQLLADEIVGSVKASEWLGPLAPIAISPFFGIACLCFISQFGGSYLPLNSFISTNPVLNNPTVLWVFVGLTLLTSLPRLTKVSKPAAQAIDQVEAWAGIITLLIIRFAASASPEVAELSQDQMVQMGVLSFTGDTLMMIAAAINVFVINTVKFFYEVLVWLIPIPFVDALLEAGNKLTCAGLMAIYAWNPVAATIINLLIFAACLMMFRWVTRQTGYMRAILFDPIRAKFSPKYGIPDKDQLTVFPNDKIGPFASKTKLNLVPTESGWQLQQQRMFLPSRTMNLPYSSHSMAIEKGLLVNSVKIDGESPGKLLFTKRFTDKLPEVATRLNIPLAAEAKSTTTGSMEISPA